MNTTLASDSLCPDVIGFGVGMGVCIAVSLISCIGAYIYRVRSGFVGCPYCDEKVVAGVLREHLIECPTHLEQWKRRVGDLGLGDQIVYVRSDRPISTRSGVNLITPPLKRGL